MSKIVPRHKVLAFYGVGATFYRMEKFAQLAKSQGASEHARHYVDESSGETDIMGINPSISYAFDKHRNLPVQEDIVNITNNGLLGNDAIRPIIIVDTETKVAYKREFSVIPNTDGDNTNVYTYNGTFKCSGDCIVGFALTSDNYRTISFVSKSALKGYTGTLFPNERTAARNRFSCSSETIISIECELTILGTDISDLELFVYVDDELQDFTFGSSQIQDRFTMLSISMDKTIPSGMHTVRITAAGPLELVDIHGYVLGQEITDEELEYSSDYNYTVDDSVTTVTGYTGSSLYIEIPEKLGGKDVTQIGDSAFTVSDIKTAYIPEGVIAIM